MNQNKTIFVTVHKVQGTLKHAVAGKKLITLKHAVIGKLMAAILNSHSFIRLL